MSKVRIIGLAASLVVVAAFLGIMLKAEERKPVLTADPDFAGKILLVSTRGHAEGGGAIEKVTTRRIGNEPYLVGKGVDTGDPDNWYKEKMVWIALHDVSQIVEFTDLDEVKKVYANRDKDK